ncbi:hypothetical protein PtA15_3A729 [Puccinia triticina]|nr:uncharacterized protein PtA15_3A729 [Puccinia triticina]WAQ83359.1 hypothetical protein PtA15_3A729 [Puccinia triticina]
MVRPGIHGASALIDAFSRLGNHGGTRAQIENYELLVVNELARVNNAYYSLTDGIVNRPDPVVLFNQVEIRTELLEQLQSKRFPSLRRHVIALSNALISRTDPQNDPVSKLKLILKILTKLDVTLDKIKFAIACINPGIDPQEVRHDQDFNKARQVICCRLDLITNLVTGHVCDLLHSSRHFMEDSGYTFAVDHPHKRAEVRELTDTCLDSIDRALDFMNKSELDFIQDAWRVLIESINDALKKFTKFINRPYPAPLSDQPRTKSSVIAVIKLARMFFAKLLQMSTDKRNFKMATHLNSRELDIFAGMNNLLSAKIEKLVDGLGRGDNGADQFENFLTVQGSIAHLQNAPKTILFMIDHFFIPVAPQADQPSHKMYYKGWFYQFNSAYRLATDDLQEAYMLTM